MGSTASMHVNRVTVCLTTQQSNFLRDGMRRHGIGLSEYLRRVLDRVLEAQELTDAARRRQS